MRFSGKWFVATVVVAAVIAAFSTAPDFVSRVAYGLDGAQAGVAQERLEGVDGLSSAFENVADVIRPSVVNISSVKRIKAPGRMGRLPAPFFNSPFHDFFGDDFFERFLTPQEPGRDYFQQGLGTGVIVSEDGYILTNNHVVSGADELTVKFSDDRTFEGKLVGADPKTDLAVVRIDAEGLHAARLGDSDKLKIGEWVVAAGNPFGLSSTITTGIVSAKGRANVGVADYEDFIQTDAAINPGNSGGPLVNLRGEVVGINTAIFTRSGGYMGIGFAIPINMAKSIMHSLIDEGRVVRGQLGALIQDLNEGLAKSFGFDGTDGVLVGDVTPNGPAQQAGLRSGDIVTRYGAKQVSRVAQLRTLVAETKPGTEVQVELFRDGATKTLEVRIGELESGSVAAGEEPSDVDLGMTMQDLTPDLARQLGYDEDTKGVVVTGVEPMGPAGRAGVLVRDVIVSVQSRPVNDLAQFHGALQDHNLSEGVRLGLLSDGSRRFVFLQVRD